MSGREVEGIFYEVLVDNGSKKDYSFVVTEFIGYCVVL